MGRASSIPNMFCRSRISATGLLLAFISTGFASSCLFHSSDRCDPGQIYNADAGLCECDNSAGRVTGEHGCVACGEHQVVKADVCKCENGFELIDSECQPTTLGHACASDADCTGPHYDSCHILSESGGYCTNTGCKNDDACSDGYACDTSAEPAYCARPPTGDGEPCQSSIDCAGTDATFCETFTTHVCYVEGCSLTANDCFGGKECCDLTGLSGGLIKKQICVKAGACTK